MINDKYIGILNRYAGEDSDSAFCTILAKVISNSVDGFILEEEKLLNDFSGFREVFVPRLKQHNFERGDVLTFTEKEVIPQEGRNPRLHYSNIGRAFAPICIELNNIEADDLFLNIELLEEAIISRFTASGTNFYVTDGIYIYGSFKIDRNRVKPSYGVKANRYLSVECLKIEHPNTEHSDISLLLHLPKENFKEIDCSTNIQLIESVKSVISKSRMNDEVRRFVNTIKDLIASESLDEFQLARVKKVQNLLDRLSFTYSEFEALRNNSGFWTNVFDNSIKDFEERLKNEFLDKNKNILEQQLEIESQKLNSIQEQLSDGEIKLQEISTVTQSKNQIIQALSHQINLLEDRKDEIILSMQIQGRIGNEVPKESKSNFEVQESSNRSTNLYERMTDFLDDLSASTELDEYTESKLHQLIKQLKNNKFFRCDNVKLFLNIIHVLGNSQIYLNNAEVDWVKFDKFVNQGLLDAFEFAYNNPSKSVYYLLLDFNIASPECYAKPLIDLSRNIRKTLPRDGRTWPSNLRIVFFPLEQDIDDFGFDVNDETFSAWEELEIPNIDCSDIELSIALNLEVGK